MRSLFAIWLLLLTAFMITLYIFIIYLPWIGWILFQFGTIIIGLIPSLYRLNAIFSFLSLFINVGFFVLMIGGLFGYAIGNFWEYVVLEVPGTKISVMLIWLFGFLLLIIFDLAFLSMSIVGGFKFLSNQLPSDDFFPLLFYFILSILTLILILGATRKTIVDWPKIKDTLINDYRKFKQEKPQSKLVWMVLLLILPLDFIVVFLTSLILLLFPLAILRQLLV